METLTFKSIEEIIDDRGFAKVNGLIKGYQIDLSSQEYLYPVQTFLVIGFGLPGGFVLIDPPEVEEEEAVLRYVGKEWIQDKEMFKQRKIDAFNEKKKELIEQLNGLVTQLERKKSVNRASESDLELLNKYVNMMIDVEELDPSQPNVELPTL